MLLYSLEAPRRDASSEYQQHTFCGEKKKIISIFLHEKSLLS